MERYLDHEVDEGSWNYLTSKFYVAEVLQSQIDLPGLAAEYRRLAELRRRPSRGQPERKSDEQIELPADERLEILSAQITTSRDGIVVDSFCVLDNDYEHEVPQDRIDDVADAIGRAVRREITVKELFQSYTRFTSSATVWPANTSEENVMKWE